MATARGRPAVIAVIQKLSSQIILVLGLEFKSLVKLRFMERTDIIQKGIEHTPIDRQTLESAVSLTAYFAAAHEIPTLCSSFKFSFLKTSIPVLTSA